MAIPVLGYKRLSGIIGAKRFRFGLRHQHEEARVSSPPKINSLIDNTSIRPAL